MKQTAVEWLAEIIAQMGYVSTELLEQAKEMEKEQIMNANSEGFKDSIRYSNGSKWLYENSEQYYIKTFKN